MSGRRGWVRLALGCATVSFIAGCVTGYKGDNVKLSGPLNTREQYCAEFIDRTLAETLKPTLAECEFRVKTRLCPNGDRSCRKDVEAFCRTTIKLKIMKVMDECVGKSKQVVEI